MDEDYENIAVLEEIASSYNHTPMDDDTVQMSDSKQKRLRTDDSDTMDTEAEFRVIDFGDGIPPRVITCEGIYCTMEEYNHHHRYRPANIARRVKIIREELSMYLGFVTSVSPVEFIEYLISQDASWDVIVRYALDGKEKWRGFCDIVLSCLTQHEKDMLKRIAIHPGNTPVDNP
jgi:hypothetical protein